jgi:hypothetical protein
MAGMRARTSRGRDSSSSRRRGRCSNSNSRSSSGSSGSSGSSSSSSSSSSSQSKKRIGNRAARPTRSGGACLDGRNPGNRAPQLGGRRAACLSARQGPRHGGTPRGDKRPAAIARARVARADSKCPGFPAGFSHSAALLPSLSPVPCTPALLAFTASRAVRSFSTPSFRGAVRLRILPHVYALPGRALPGRAPPPPLAPAWARRHRWPRAISLWHGLPAEHPPMA